MASTIVDQATGGLFGSPPSTTSGSTSVLGTVMADKSRLGHKGEDPGGGDGETPSAESLRKTLDDVVSRESYAEVQKMKRDIEKLSKFERLLLYLDLPSSLTGMTDPLRQPLNPLGSRHEIQLTITWIKTHLEEDSQVSLPKHEVYDDYLEYCNHNGLKQLSTADFGKVMKQVFPQVRPRRLGTRGNSRYCYAGLKKRLKLEDPSTPEFCNDKSVKEIKSDFDEELNNAVSHLIREWVEKLLGIKFNSLSDLAAYLIEKMYVDNSSNQAFAVMSAMQKSVEGGTNLVNGNNQPLDAHDYKRKIDIPPTGSDIPLAKRGNLKRSKYSPNSLMRGPNPLKDPSRNDDIAVSTANDFDGFSRLCQSQPPPVSSSQNTFDPPPPPPPPPLPPKDHPMSDIRGGDTAIDEELGHYFNPKDKLESDENQTYKICQLRQLLEKNLQSPTLNMVSSNSAFKLAKSELQSSEWGSYSTQNTQNQEDRQEGEVVNNQGTSLSSRRRVSFNPLVVQEVADGSTDLANTPAPNVTIGAGNNVGNQLAAAAAAAAVAAASGANSGGNGLIAGQSPVTRKRHFSFQPISPRQASLPQSPSASPFISPRSTPVPNIMRSRHSSGSALPLHLLPQGSSVIGIVGGSSGNAGAKLHNFNSSSSDVSRAATFGSASECSTPFISPHGTPIPFSRSRHNSAQGRLCRSRHSSGVTTAPCRYNMTFSPMALNNLNNPYSPQPATPVATTCGEDMFVTTYVGDSIGNGGAGHAIQVQGGNTIILHHNDDPRSRHSSAGSCDMNAVHSAPISPHCGVKDVMIDPNSGSNNGVGIQFSQQESKRIRHASAGAMNYHGQSLQGDWITHKQPQPVTLVQHDQPAISAVAAAQASADELLRSQSVPLSQLESRNSEFSLTEASNNPNFASVVCGTGSGDAMEFLNAAASSAGTETSPPPLGSLTSGVQGNHNSNSSDSDRKDVGGGSGGGPGGSGQDDLELTLSDLKDCGNGFSGFFETESGK